MPGACILDARLRPVVVELTCANGYVSPFGRVTYGVVQESGKDLAGAPRISAYRQPVRDLHLEPHAFGRCPSQETAGRLRRYDREVEGFLLHLEPAGV
jgi:hypothetical protein